MGAVASELGSTTTRDVGSDHSFISPSGLFWLLLQGPPDIMKDLKGLKHFSPLILGSFISRTFTNGELFLQTLSLIPWGEN